MPLRKIYIDVIWKPGSVWFARRTPRMVSDGGMLEAAIQLRLDIATKSVDTMGRSVEILEPQFYFEIFDDPKSTKPILRSDNAP